MQLTSSLIATCGIGLLVGILLGCIPAESSTSVGDASIYVWSRKGLDEGRFIKPRAITIDASDNLYIVDTTSRIQVFNRDGKFLRSWRTPQCVQGKPCGLSISNDGLLMVCDTHYFRVLFYQPDGTLVEERTIGGTNGRGPGEFGFITDVVQDSHDNYYIAEYGDYDRIQKFTPAGKFIYEWGEHGTEAGQFLRPQGLAIDKRDQLWIADASNHRVQVFDVSGEQPEFVKTWGDPGSKPGKLSYPYSLEVDSGGTVYVGEMGNHRIQAFTSDGQSLGTWGGAGRAPGQLHQPWAFCRDSTGSFHVLDSYNHRVQRFEFDVDSVFTKSATTKPHESTSRFRLLFKPRGSQLRPTIGPNDMMLSIPTPPHRATP